MECIRWRWRSYNRTKFHFGESPLQLAGISPVAMANLYAVVCSFLRGGPVRKQMVSHMYMEPPCMWGQILTSAELGTAGNPKGIKVGHL